MTTLPLPRGKKARSITFKDAINQFFAELPFMKRRDGQPLAEGTRSWYRYELTRLLRVEGKWGKMAEVPLLEVTAEQIAAWPVTSSFGQCVRRLYTYHQLATPRGFCVPPQGQRQRILTPIEFRRLLCHCPSDSRDVMWILWMCWESGTRPRELRELVWSEVNEGQRCLSLLKFKAQERRKDGLKVRRIAISAAAAKILGRWRKQRRPGPFERVFTNRRGKPWTANALRQAVRNACRKAKLDPIDGGERVVCYSLRHTFATTMAEGMLKKGTYDITLLTDLMGHSSVDTTRRYIHRQEKQLVAGYDQFRQ